MAFAYGFTNILSWVIITYLFLATIRKIISLYMAINNIQPAQITKVLANSIAAEIGFDIGDAIVAINGTKPRDLIASTLSFQRVTPPRRSTGSSRRDCLTCWRRTVSVDFSNLT